VRERFAAFLSLVVVISLAGFARAAPAPEADPLAARADAVRALFAADPKVPDDLFAPSFLASVPAAKVAAIGKQVFAEAGALKALRLVQRDGPHAAKFEGEFANGAVAPFALAVEPTPPHRLTALWFGNLAKPAGAAVAAPPGEDPLAARAEAVRALFVAAPTVPDGLFAPSFLAAVSPAKVIGISKETVAKVGRLEELRLVTRTGPFAGKYRGVFADGSVAPFTIGLEPTPPHRISTLWLGEVAKPVDAATLGDLAPRFAELPGQVSFAACRLGDGKPEVVASHEPERALGLGSTFKLWILGTLARDVADGKHRWDEVVRLSKRDRSMPSGRLQDWPEGAPVTLHTLAALMISQSDNTATDTLLRTLGREHVEETMARMGASAAARNRPFLSTAELFALKGVWPKERSQAFAAADEATRRKLLAGGPVDLTSFQDWSAPYELDRLEWFASATDLCRALDWLRRAGAKKGGEPVLDILGINEGLPQSGKFAYHGFKGGSEPGVVAHAHLLRTKDGAWWVLAAVWNDPAAPVTSAKLHPLLERGFELIAGEKAQAAAK
jgi:beta-lactamase class A